MYQRPLIAYQNSFSASQHDYNSLLVYTVAMISNSRYNSPNEVQQQR